MSHMLSTKQIARSSNDKTFASIDSITFLALYTTLVRPHLEYGNVVWGPTYSTDCIVVERLQRRATRLVSSIRHLTYIERLESLGLPSLHYRRKRGDMIQVYKILTGKERIEPLKFFYPISLHNNQRTRHETL